jgi:DNA-binding NarL/FixJ family response regulator
MIDGTGKIRILIADDHPIVREGLIAILATQADFEVVGEATNGVELLQKAQTLAPNVVLTDLEMPEIDGVEAIRQLRAILPDVQVIVLTVYNTDDRIVSSLQVGAQGYLLKGAPRNEIFEAIRVVNSGGSLLHPVVASRLIERMRTDTPVDDLEPLTEREMDVLKLLAQGKVNKEIAAALVITERTVKFHVSAIMSKLGATNRTEAVTIAVQRGLVTLS